VLVAFDGSRESEAAVRAAAELFQGRTLLVASVWEPGMAMALTSYPDPAGVAYAVPTADQIALVDRAQETHAAAMADAGARLARELGATAQALPVPDSVNVAETVAAAAQQHDAAAVVVGSRGLGGVKARLLGSTSRRLLHDARVPVLVVRAPDRSDER
jgi:nucleotide-binding universal stress UspA family protein